MNYLENLKKYLAVRLEFIITEDLSLMSQLMGFKTYMIENFKPKKFDPYDSGNEVVQKERDFEMMCSAMEEAGINNCKGMTVFEFYSRIKHFEKRNKSNDHVS